MWMGLEVVRSCRRGSNDTCWAYDVTWMTLYCNYWLKDKKKRKNWGGVWVTTRLACPRSTERRPFTYDILSNNNMENSKSATNGDWLEEPLAAPLAGLGEDPTGRALRNSVESFSHKRFTFYQCSGNGRSDVSKLRADPIQIPDRLTRDSINQSLLHLRNSAIFSEASKLPPFALIAVFSHSSMELLATNRWWWPL